MSARGVLFPQALWPFTMATIVVFNATAEAEQSNWAALEDSKVGVSFRIQPPVGSVVQGSSKVVFSNKYALSAVYDPAGRYGNNWTSPVLFDLEQMAWFDVSTKRWVLLKSCQEWEKTSIERTKVSLAKSPNDDARAFAEAMINPQLQLQKQTDGSSTIFNSHIKYAVVPATNAPSHILQRFNAYDQLNAYHKAMSERQLPPTTQIAVDKYLAKEKIFPKQMIVTIKTATGNVIATTDASVETFDTADAELIRREIAQSQQ